MASVTMRYCVQTQLYLGEFEPEPENPTVRFQIQMRRRIFWCAYKLDRVVAASFEIPPAIPDEMISVKVCPSQNSAEVTP